MLESFRGAQGFPTSEVDPPPSFKTLKYWIMSWLPTLSLRVGNPAHNNS